MKIRIIDEDLINRTIASAEGGATARTITHKQVIAEKNRIEQWLNLHNIPYKVRAKLCFLCDPNAQSFANSYRYCPESTQFYLTIGSDGKKWFLTGVKRLRCTPERCSLTVTTSHRTDLEKAICHNAYAKL